MFSINDHILRRPQCLNNVKLDELNGLIEYLPNKLKFVQLSQVLRTFFNSLGLKKLWPIF